jgi:hypothetical protein
MALDSFVADVKTACSSSDGSPQYWKEAVERLSNSKVEALLDQNAADLPKALEVSYSWGTVSSKRWILGDRFNMACVTKTKLVIFCTCALYRL